MSPDMSKWGSRWPDRFARHGRGGGVAKHAVLNVRGNLDLETRGGDGAAEL